MDFALTDDQISLQQLAREILTEQVTNEHLKALEAASQSVFDRGLWKQSPRPDSPASRSLSRPAAPASASSTSRSSSKRLGGPWHRFPRSRLWRPRTCSAAMRRTPLVTGFRVLPPAT